MGSKGTVVPTGDPPDPVLGNARMVGFLAGAGASDVPVDVVIVCATTPPLGPVGPSSDGAVTGATTTGAGLADRIG